MGWEETPEGYVSPADLRLLVDALAEAVLVADGRGSIRFANETAGELLGAEADQLLGATLPFSPADKLAQLPNQEGDFALLWSRTRWEGNAAWALIIRPQGGEQEGGNGEWEHKAVQSNLRVEQLTEQLKRLQDQVRAGEDQVKQGETQRQELQLMLNQARSDLQDAHNQLDYYVDRLRESDARVREIETAASEQAQEAQDLRGKFEMRVQQLNAQLVRAEESERQLRYQLQEASQRVGPPTQIELQAQHAQRRLSEQLQRIQLLEAELEALNQRGANRDDGSLDELKAESEALREQAARAEERSAQLEQLLKEHEEKNTEYERRAELLTQRLAQTEQMAEQTRQGLEQQLQHLSAEDQQTKRLAFEDQLTNLPNQNILQQYLDFTSGMVERNEGAAILLLIDIDRLRVINTTMNNAAGDEVLRQFAARLKGLCRNTDVLGRRGDDEFLVVVAHKSADARELSLARTTVAQMAQSLANKLIAATQEPFQLAGSPVQMTCSIGMASFDDSVETVLEQAQVALDRARELGRARFQFFGPELQDRMRKRSAVVPRLREALERQEFLMHYQPIVDLRTGKMVGIEALLRWHDPSLGLLEPAEFLQAAETSGLIVEIGEWAVQEACLMAAQFRDLFVSVNLSPRQLMHGDFARRFMKAIERARVKPDKIVVEISEATSSADPERISQVLGELARWNVGLAIDDFGTGSSNLLRLQREKPRFLKIDTAFVNGLPDDKTSFHIVLAACHLAASLQMQSLAEGVEKDSQLQNLKRMGCHLAQGRLLSPPVAAGAIRDMTRKTWKIG